MSWVRTSLILIVLWSVVYLPGLGSQEIRGEEWRRVLPGRTMLNTREWVVPQIGARPYLRKPPLINWITAGSFKLFGVQNEWSARIPSALTILGAALGMTWMMGRVIGSRGALLAGVMLLGMSGVVEKGRMAELEVYYIAFTGLAFAAWLAGFTGRMSKGWSWGLAGVFLGLGMLIKGPVHLLFFYGLVFGAVWKTKRWREIWSLWHGVAVLLYVGIFAAWAVPFVKAYGAMMGVEPGEVWTYWKEQLASRTEGDERTTALDWILRGPEALALFLPWILLLPFGLAKVWRNAVPVNVEMRQVFQGLFWGAVAGFAVMVLLPSSSPRYVMPLCGPVAVLSAWWLSEWSEKRGSVGAFKLEHVWRLLLRWGVVLMAVALVITCGILIWSADSHRFLGVLSMVLGLFMAVWIWKDAGLRTGKLVSFCGWTTIAMGLGALLVTTIDVRRPESLRALAREIDAAMRPKDGSLYVFRMGPLPYLFYLPVDAVEENVRKELPPSGVRWMLTNDAALEKFGRRLQRDYGKIEWRKDFYATWGEEELGDKMVLVRFAGHEMQQASR